MEWLAHCWGTYWCRALMLVGIAAAITLTAGFLAWLFGAFKLDRDDIRHVTKQRASLQRTSIPRDFSALPSQEPNDIRGK
jgi:hypothetical protein